MARTQRRTIRLRGLSRPLRGITRRHDGKSPQPEDVLGHWRELQHGDLRWIDIRPTHTAVDGLREQFQFHHLALDDILSYVQRPKLDDFDNYLFIVLHFPRFDKKEKVAVSSEVDFFLGPDYIITAHWGELSPLTRLWDRLAEDDEARERYMDGSSEMLLYHIVDTLTNYLFPMMMRIDSNLDELSERIFRGDPRRAVRNLGAYRRDLISLRRITRPDMLVVSTLENGRASLLREEMQPYWGDIADHFQRVWDMLSEFKEEIESLDDTFNTLYSYRINETLRALTIISVILLPLTLITGLFGMNVELPFGLGESPYAFWIIIGAMGLLAGSMLAFFIRNEWL